MISLPAALQEHPLLQKLQSYITFKGLVLGIGGVLAFYALIGAWVAMRAETTVESWEKRIPHKSVVIKGSYDAPDVQGMAHLEEISSVVPLLPVSDDAFKNLYKESGALFVPVIRYHDNVSVFDAFKRPFEGKPSLEKPLISVAVVGLGLSDTATHSAIRSMPPEISLIFSPYSQNLQKLVDASRARGHEVWLTLPMETERYPYDDPGPHTLIIGAPERQNNRKMLWLMGQAQGVVGFAGQEDAIFLQAPHDMRSVMGTLLKSGMGFINTEEGVPSAVLDAMATGMNAPYATSDIWLDKTPQKSDIREALARLEDKARDTGRAIGVIHTYPVSYHETLQWLKTLEQKGFILAPLSAQAQN